MDNKKRQIILNKLCDLVQYEDVVFILNIVRCEMHLR